MRLLHRSALVSREPVGISWEEHQRLLGAFAESFGLEVTGYHQPDGHGQEHMVANVHDPRTGDEGEIRMPGWLLQRLLEQSR